MTKMTVLEMSQLVFSEASAYTRNEPGASPDRIISRAQALIDHYQGVIRLTREYESRRKQADFFEQTLEVQP